MSSQIPTDAPPGLQAFTDALPGLQTAVADFADASLQASNAGISSGDSDMDTPPPTNQGGGKEELVKEVTAAVREHVEKKTAAAVDTLWLKGQKALQQMQQQQLTQTQELQGALSSCAEMQDKLEQENAMLRQALEALMQRLQTVFVPPPHLGQPAYLPAPSTGSDAAQAAALAAVAAQATARAASLSPSKAAPAQAAAPLDPDEATQEETSRPSLDPEDFQTPGSPRRLAAPLEVEDAGAEPPHTPVGLLPPGAGSNLSTPSSITTPFTPPPAPKFLLTLRRADQVPLGLDVRGDAGATCLLVDGVRVGGAVEAWNRQCAGDQREIRPGDRIVAVNGVEDADGMRQECRDKHLLKIAVVRCAFSDAATTAAGSSVGSHLSSPVGSIFMRADADEFVPGGPTSAWSPMRSLPSPC